MTGSDLGGSLKGKEVHIRLVSNDLLEDGKPSSTAVGKGNDVDALLAACRIETSDYTKYPPESMTRKITDGLLGRSIAMPSDPQAVVLVAEKDGSLSADDARYIEWLAGVNREYPRVIMVPAASRPAQTDGPRRLLDDSQLQAGWSVRQWRRLKALPAPITRAAALAAIPRTVIPVAACVILAYIKRDSVPLLRSGAYIGLQFGFAIGFALFNETVLNYITFCGELTHEIFDPAIRAIERALGRNVVSRAVTNILEFVSSRGDVLIAGPSLGVLCTYLSRLALGPVGETDSVLTLMGFYQVCINVLVGSFAGGPYAQVLAHLRAVGRITNNASMYLGIVETIKMQLGHLSDFGYQKLFNSIQFFIAVTFWLMLLVVDRCYRKPEIVRLSGDEAESAARLFAGLRARAKA